MADSSNNDKPPEKGNHIRSARKPIQEDKDKDNECATQGRKMKEEGKGGSNYTI